MKNDYLYTAIHKSVSDFIPESDSTYIYGMSAEDRSHFVESLVTRGTENVNYLELQGLNNEIVIDAATDKEIHLRSSSSVTEAIKKFGSKNIYIDVTGLDNRVCAAFIKNAMDMYMRGDITNVRVVYAEPESYDIKQFKTESVFNDLSERIEGISPLPGFATIFPQDEERIFLIALLGFEGGRFSHMLESVQPPKENVIPIVGVPGFRPEYPYVAYWGNNRPLKETETWRKVKFASANSLVEVYMLLSKILKKNPTFKIKLAPIGTKPHAIAAMLFAIKHPRAVELVYDNPKRQKRRTDGIGNLVECLVSKLIVDN